MMKDKPSLIGSSGDSMRESFGKEITKLAKIKKNIVLLDADINGGTGAHHFLKKYPSRFFQFGIAEQNMMSVASGMSTEGLIPVVTGFAVFLLRAFEQARLSIGYSNRNVKIVASHPGLDVGPDGGSAQCLEDLSAFRSIPNFVVLSPADQTEMEYAVKQMINHEGPIYMRTGRSPAKRVLKSKKFKKFKGQILREGHDLSIIACGVQVSRALEAAEMLSASNISARVVNMSTIKPIDKDLVVDCSKKTGCIVTSEDHSIYGGLGSAVSEVVSMNYPCRIVFNGVKDIFGESGEPDELAKKYGISSDGLVKDCLRALKNK